MDSLTALSDALTASGTTPKPLDFEAAFGLTRSALASASAPSAGPLPPDPEDTERRARARQALTACLWRLLDDGNATRASLEALTRKFKILAYEHDRAGDALAAQTRAADSAARALSAEKARNDALRRDLQAAEARARASREDLTRVKSAYQSLKVHVQHDLRRRDADAAAAAARLPRDASQLTRAVLNGDAARDATKAARTEAQAPQKAPQKATHPHRKESQKTRSFSGATQPPPPPFSHATRAVSSAVTQGRGSAPQGMARGEGSAMQGTGPSLVSQPPVSLGPNAPRLSALHAQTASTSLATTAQVSLLETSLQQAQDARREAQLEALELRTFASEVDEWAGYMADIEALKLRLSDAAGVQNLRAAQISQVVLHKLYEVRLAVVDAVEGSGRLGEQPTERSEVEGESTKSTTRSESTSRNETTSLRSVETVDSSLHQQTHTARDSTKDRDSSYPNRRTVSAEKFVPSETHVPSEKTHVPAENATQVSDTSSDKENVHRPRPETTLLSTDLSEELGTLRGASRENSGSRPAAPSKHSHTASTKGERPTKKARAALAERNGL